MSLPEVSHNPTIEVIDVIEVIQVEAIGAGFTPLAESRIIGKRRIRRLKNQRPFDRIIVAPLSGDSLIDEGIEDGDYAVLKLNFEPTDIRPDRLVVVRCPAGLIIKKLILTEEGLARLVSASPTCPDLFFDLDVVHVEALVMRIDRTVYELF
jgi:phage repressor protein C with HTH and peptisase S24 domain